MAIQAPDLNQPYESNTEIFGAPQTGVATTASAFHALMYVDKPTYVLDIKINMVGVDSGQTATACYGATALSGASTTAFGAATAIGIGTGLKTLDVDNSTNVPTLVPAGTWIGFLTNATAVTNSKMSHAVLKTRPQF